MWASDDPITISAEVYATMRRRILRGDLAMGEVISRRRVAADLSTSLQTVTAALLRLEYEGLLEHRARAGTRVPVSTPDAVRGHYVVVEALEVQAVLLFAALATQRERTELDKLARRVDELAAEGDAHAYFAAHQRLHLRIAECSQSPLLRQESDKAYARAALWLVSLRPSAPFDGAMRHQAFVARLVDGDGQGAVQAVREHIAEDTERALGMLERYMRTRRLCRERFDRAVTAGRDVDDAMPRRRPPQPA